WPFPEGSIDVGKVPGTRHQVCEPWAVMNFQLQNNRPRPVPSIMSSVIFSDLLYLWLQVGIIRSSPRRHTSKMIFTQLRTQIGRIICHFTIRGNMIGKVGIVVS